MYSCQSVSSTSTSTSIYKERRTSQKPATTRCYIYESSCLLLMIQQKLTRQRNETRNETGNETYTFRDIIYFRLRHGQ